jgi:transposase
VLVVAYMLRKRGCVYQDLGGDYFERINQDQLTRYHIKNLQRLGFTVTVTPQNGGSGCIFGRENVALRAK